MDDQLQSVVRIGLRGVEIGSKSNRMRETGIWLPVEESGCASLELVAPELGFLNTNAVVRMDSTAARVS
jgi:hypothetical protein